MTDFYLRRGTRVHVEGHGDGAVAYVRRTKDGVHTIEVSVTLDSDGGKLPTVWEPARVHPIIGSGYVDCACRDCFDVAIASSTDAPAFCHECAGHGCELDAECSRPDAYGVEEECDERTA